MEDVIKFEKKNRTVVIQLNRPEVHNAVNEAMMTRLEEILSEIESDRKTMVIILTATGSDSFCAGGDLKYFATFKNREAALAMSHRMQAILNRLENGICFVIAAVNGQAFGGGCELLTASHYRIAAENAVFSYRQAANGLITGWGGGVRLFNLLGRTKALRLLLTSEILDAKQALEVGLIDQVVPAGEQLNAALSLAEAITKNSAEAVRAFLKIFRNIRPSGSEEATKLETELFGDLWIGEDFRKWLMGFLKKE